MTNTEELHKQYIRHLNSLEKRIDKIEKLFSQKKLSKRDVEQIYMSFFLDSVCSFEAFLENLFIIILLNKNNSLPKSIKPFVVFSSVQTAKKALLNVNGRDYLDWLPYKRTCSLSVIYFRQGFPFSTIGFRDKNDPQIKSIKGKLGEIVIIRNAIAHKSSSSQKKFNKIVSSTFLLPREKQPGGYLRSRISGNGQTRYEMYISVLAEVANRLCKPLNIS